MKTGIFGGAFNPVHNGHLRLAREYYNSLGLDRLIFIPTSQPPHKSGEHLAPPGDRLNMLRLALEGTDFELSDIEFKRGGKSYTYDTLTQLKKMYPDDSFYLIIGADQFLTFDKWYRHKDIIDMAAICTCARENEDEKEQLRAFAQRLDLGEGRFFLTQAPVFKVSSSEVRLKIKNGGDVSRLIDKNVFNYILEKELYGV